LARPTLPDWQPNFAAKTDTLREKAKTTIFRAGQIIEKDGQVVSQSSVWNLELSFKPLRMIEVDIPQPTGKMQRKKLWYLVYRVANYGYHLSSMPVLDEFQHAKFDPASLNHRIFFFPHFVLAGNVPMTAMENGGRVERYERKEYLDRLVPAAMKPIAERERVGATLHDSVSISKTPIEISIKDANGKLTTDKSVWGVVIWEDIDPRVDYLSIYVQGLTNAYRFEDPPNAYKAGDPIGTGRKFVQKTLQLNFWRPGDAIDQHEEEVRFGVPVDDDPVRREKIYALYSIPGPLDHQWVYR
jgi:hypothetical protein